MNEWSINPYACSLSVLNTPLRLRFIATLVLVDHQDLGQSHWVS